MNLWGVAEGEAEGGMGATYGNGSVCAGLYEINGHTVGFDRGESEGRCGYRVFEPEAETLDPKYRSPLVSLALGSAENDPRAVPAVFVGTRGWPS